MGQDGEINAIRFTPLQRLAFDLGVAIRADENKKFFTEDYIKAIAEWHAKYKKEAGKLWGICISIAALQFLYVSGIKFSVSYQGARLEEVQGLLEIMIFLAANSALGLSALLTVQYSLQRIVKKYVTDLNFPLGAELYTIKFLPDTIFARVISGQSKLSLFSVGHFAFSLMMTFSYVLWLLAIPVFFFYVQVISIQHAWQKPTLPSDLARVILIASIAINAVATISFAGTFLMPFKNRVRKRAA